MTEKRFECDKGSRIIIDNETKLHYIMTLDWECSLVTKLLNRFAEENEQLKSTINTLTHDNTKMKKVLNTTKNENEQIKQVIKEAYNNERTKLGQSVLKQLLNNIEG